ncbi:hypothetical protein SHKM778_06390 [Streptomyces sp. KM77-8]|uniref:Secreted protein n=1 Tax=Streptomyces haneummycinicus TaxID=3074435 RepID=A0AAT9HA11_9ACTN
MRSLSRRGMLGLGAGAAAALPLAGCGGHQGSDGGGHKGSDDGAGAGGSRPGRDSTSKPTPKPTKTARPIGDGSTSFTGEQPHQPDAPVPLEPGQTPPQFVVFSWDGAGEVGNGLFPRFLDLAKEHGASMTFFLSGVYLLPESKKRLYDPPNNPRGASDIGYLTDGHIKDTLKNIRRAWLEGHEIGTHFNGHFCGGSGSVGNWTSRQWRSEIDQAKSFVKEWRTNSGWTDLESLPFDYDKELVGGRTPCLLGQDRLLPTARELGWRYDASSPGGRQVWPVKRQGIWDLPCSRYRSPAAPSKSCRWTTTCSPTSRSTRPTRPPTTTRAGASSRPSRTYPASSGHTSRIAHPSSSGTTSSSGTAASTWTPSSRRSSTSRGRRRRAAT